MLDEVKRLQKNDFFYQELAFLELSVLIDFPSNHFSILCKHLCVKK